MTRLEHFGLATAITLTACGDTIVEPADGGFVILGCEQDPDCDVAPTDKGCLHWRCAPPNEENLRRCVAFQSTSPACADAGL